MRAHLRVSTDHLINHRALPYENTDNPKELQEQAVKGEMRLPKEIDTETRDLLNGIFNVVPDQRLTVKQIMEKPYWRDFDWERVRQRDWRQELASDGKSPPELGNVIDVPYKPNPNAFSYLMDN